MGRRIKVSLTLDESVVKAVDREAAKAKKKKPNRSEVVEHALRLWIRELKRMKLDMEIEEYYRSLTPKDREEDAEWAGLGDVAVRDIWDES